ncbi:hypothetical protein RJ640_020085 [Escallonia rubra]|uniref:Uncharacterized protein n=1 Tax=Escallonia rubra TaxID=112253 RepID=A0AA88QZQ1_9ASTE|nr:hypothetical protein RJ640_020085 [Escallonia rubra]
MDDLWVSFVPFSFQSSGCLGCDIKPKPITSVNEPQQRQKLQTRTVSKPSISEDFWTTSTCDMDNSAAQSRGSISSISTSNQALDAHGTGRGNIPSEFVNHGNCRKSSLLLVGNMHYIGSSNPPRLIEMKVGTLGMDLLVKTKT